MKNPNFSVIHHQTQAWDHYQWWVQMLDNVLMFPQYPQFPHKYTIWNWQTMYIFQHLISIIYCCSVCIISGEIFWTILKQSTLTIIFLIFFIFISSSFPVCGTSTDTGWSGILTIVCRIPNWSQGISLQQLWSVHIQQNFYLFYYCFRYNNISK